MDRDEAESQIIALFEQYTKVTPADEALLTALSDGKLYEMYVLSELVTNLTRRGCRLTFHGSSLKFKAGPGKIKISDPHFTVQTPAGLHLWLYVDIEFETLGQVKIGSTDLSSRHELDIVIVSPCGDYPSYTDIWLGVECKSTANFGKHLIKEVLGVRREMTLLDQSQPSLLSQAGLSPIVGIPSNPPSEFWLAFIDPAGQNYTRSPAAFGIELRLVEP